jgi:hypothetical protein
MTDRDITQVTGGLPGVSEELARVRGVLHRIRGRRCFELIDPDVEKRQHLQSCHLGPRAAPLRD